MNKLHYRGSVHIVLLFGVGVLVAAAGYSLSSGIRRAKMTNSASESIVEESKNINDGDSYFTFAAAGDFKNTTEAQMVLESIGLSGSDFTLALGDLGYLENDRTEQQWCDFVKDNVGNAHPFQIVAGNHDDGRDGDITEYVKCLPNKIEGITGQYGLNYYFDYNNIARFIMISPDIDNYGDQFTKDSEELLWLENAITEANNEDKWVVLGMHKNCITPGLKPCEIGKEVFNKSIELGVDLILQGHEHAYFRSKQLNVDESAGCPEIVPNEFNSNCVVAEDGLFRSGSGSVLVISGAGGMPLREANKEDPEAGYFESLNAKSLNEAHGYNIFKVSTDEINARFASVTGNFTDEFTIQK